MDFRKYLAQTAKKLDKEIQKILNKWLKDVEKTDENLVPLAKAFIKSCNNGKRIRGTLVRLGYEMARSVILNEVKDLSRMRLSNKLRDSSLIAQNDNEDIVKIGAALEILHTAILAHDDIIDQSPKRRGQPSLYKSIGVSQAITLGDLGFFLAIKIISESNFPDKKKNQALNLFSKSMIDTAQGQMLDIQKGDPLIIMRLKTAKYTIAGPLQIGAILAGAKLDQLDKLDQFGESLGIAFQIQDDILDGEALDYKGSDALKYVSRAKQLIPKITNDPKISILLKDMADYLVERKS